jgi:hypothetical protein
MSEREKWIEVEGDKPKVEASQAFFVELRASLKNALDVTSDVSMQTAELLTENNRLRAELEQAEKNVAALAAALRLLPFPLRNGNQSFVSDFVLHKARAALREAKQP